MGVKALLLVEEMFPGFEQLGRTPLPIRERGPRPSDRLVGQPEGREPRNHGAAAQEQAPTQKRLQAMKEAEIGA